MPSESTFRRVLQRLDADAFDALAGEWAARRTAPGPKQRRVIAVDGKTLRGSAHDGGGGRHLLAALDQAHGVVLGQVEVGAKTNEIPMFTALLDRLDIQDAVITADALHAQREHARTHAQLAAIIRGHWGIEDRLHWVRDLDFDEDRSQVRTTSGPQIMASLRNLVITILRLSGATSIAAALRHHARRPARPLRTIMKC